MSQQVYSVVFWHTLLTVSATQPTQLYVVPAGHVAIVRDIDHWTGSGVPSRADYGEATQNLFWTAVQLTGTGHLAGAWRGRQVFEPGMVVTGQADADLVFSRGSGYLLTTP